MDLTITYKYQSPISNDINMLCCVCFYFVALDVSLGFHFLFGVCYVNPAYGCQIEINCELTTIFIAPCSRITAFHCRPTFAVAICCYLLKVTQCHRSNIEAKTRWDFKRRTIKPHAHISVLMDEYLLNFLNFILIQSWNVPIVGPTREHKILLEIKSTEPKA